MCCALREYVEPTCSINEIQTCDVMVPDTVAETVLRMGCIFIVLFNFILIIAELARRSQDR